MTVRARWRLAAGILSAAALAAWVGESVAAQGLRPGPAGVGTIPFAYFLNDGLRPIDDCTFSIVTDGHPPARVAVEGERLRVGAADGMRRLEFRCGEYPPDGTASVDLFPTTSTVVFTAYTRPKQLDKALKPDESKWSDERREGLDAFHEARESLRKSWLAIPRSARAKAGGAFAWRASNGSTVVVSATFRYADQPQPTTLPVGLAGSWNIQSRVNLRSEHVSAATANAWVGRTARFATTTAEFGLERCAATTYVQITADPERFFLLELGYSVKKLGLTTKKVPIIILSCAGAAWNAPSGFVVRDKNHVLAFSGSVFFEMARAD